ncbi:hypothetical protein V7128_16890 [Neobacillus vireti]|uniref:hypothetical protein n=1 Tax=Neobacillus vireti TaxID=220686 RepID=UPI002FFF148D
MNKRKVTVKHIFQNEVDHDFSDIGVFYDDCGIVVSCDQFGLVEVYKATPVEGSNVVLVDEGAKDLSSDNPELVIGLIAGDIVKVQFIYDGISLPSETRSGVLLANNRVFVYDNEGPGIYAAQSSSIPNTVIVNFDENQTDYLAENSALLIDLITG